MSSYDGTIEVKRNSRTPFTIDFARDSATSLDLNTAAEAVRIQVANADQTGYLVQNKTCEITGADQVQGVWDKTDFLSVEFGARSGSAKVETKEYAIDVEVLWDGQTDYQKLECKFRLVLHPDYPINVDLPA